MKYFYKNNTFSLLLFLIVVLISVNSCKKEEPVKEPEKTSGKIMYWQTTATSQKYNINMGISKLSVFINDKYIGFFETKYHWATEPTCGATNALTYDYDLGTKSSEAFKVEIRNYTTDDILQTEQDTVTNGGCAKFELK